MNLTKESQYALQGLARLASYDSGAVVPTAEIAAAEELPTTFLAKIFQKLARHGLLEAERGRGSGYTLATPPDAIRVREILEAIEGSQALKRCLLWGGVCSEDDPCPLHFRIKALRPQFDALLNDLTLADFVEQSLHLTSAPESRK